MLTLNSNVLSKSTHPLFLLLFLLSLFHHSNVYAFPWKHTHMSQLATSTLLSHRNPFNRPEHAQYHFPNPQYNGEDRKKPVCPTSDLSNSGGRRWTVNMECVETTGKKGFDYKTLQRITHISKKTNTQRKTHSEKKKNIGAPQKREVLRTRYYGKPGLPNNVFEIVKLWNTQFPRKAIKEEAFLCDMIYCYSNGTVAFVEENAPPYDGKYGPYLDEENQKEPRFIIQATSGYIARNNIKPGQEFEAVNKQNREEIFDNFFSEPKNFRQPLLLPNGRYIE